MQFKTEFKISDKGIPWEKINFKHKVTSSKPYRRQVPKFSKYYQPLTWVLDGFMYTISQLPNCLNFWGKW